MKLSRAMKSIAFLPALVLALAVAHAQAPPPAELKDPFLDNFVGNWRVERTSGKGRKTESTVRVEWALKHHFIELHYGAGEKAPEYEALVFIGFVEAEKSYSCYWLDVFGAAFDGIGHGKLDEKLQSIEFQFQFSDGALTNKFSFDPATKTWTSLMRQVEKGEWKTFAEEKWTRAEPDK